jgi:hypothetical protein
MDKDKDIGLICDLYSNKDETQLINKNQIVNSNDNKISDIENSITASLLNNNNTSLLICDNRIIVCCKLTTVILFLGLLVFGVYFLINTLN